jgi:hypothetical protein
MDGGAFRIDLAETGETPSAGSDVVVHGRVVRLPAAVAERLLPEGTAAADAGRFGFGVDCARVSAAGLRSSLGALLANDVASEMAQPRVPCQLGKQAHLTMVEQRSYVSAFRMEAKPKAMIADPVVGIVQAGYHLTVQPEIDGDRVALALSLRAADVVEPMASAMLALAPGTLPVQIQLPVLFHQELDTRPRLRPGEAVCVTWPRSRELDRVVMLVLECERGAPQALAAMR